MAEKDPALPGASIAEKVNKEGIKKGKAKQSKEVFRSMRKKNIWQQIVSYLKYGLISFVLIWNWDGFWQTNIGFLMKMQQSYFPVKYAIENEQEQKILTLQEEQGALRKKLETAEKASGGFAQQMATVQQDRRREREFLKAAIYTINALRHDIADDKLEKIQNDYPTNDCRQLLNSGKSIFETLAPVE